MSVIDTCALPPPLAGPLKPITEPIQIPKASFSAVVTLSVEEYNRIQGEIERLQKVAEERAARIAELEKKPDFDELWDRITKSPGLFANYCSKDYRNILLIPSSTGDAIEYRVGERLRKELGWPQNEKLGNYNNWKHSFKASIEPDFDELWARILKSPDFAVPFEQRGDRHIWFVPTYRVPDSPEFRMKPAIRDLVKWPEHGMDMVTNKRALYTQSGPASSLYSKLIALAAANSQPK